jgi:hypothetical protein
MSKREIDDAFLGRLSEVINAAENIAELLREEVNRLRLELDEEEEDDSKKKD